MLSEWGISDADWAGADFAAAPLEDNGRDPASPSVRLNGGQLVWSGRSERDVIGYRVYVLDHTGGRRVVAVIKRGEATAFSALKPGAAYCVTAVDIAGRESAPSASVSLPSAAPHEPPAQKGDDAGNNRQPPADGNNAANGNTQPPASR
ncbi:hypothetical protein [Geobacillus stearothermophilus]|uniref:hypothetical protein n=1 Tax=Geobacillus stearothermophilus TaxID=1422 RepID=UPI003D662ED7